MADDDGVRTLVAIGIFRNRKPEAPEPSAAKVFDVDLELSMIAPESRAKVKRLIALDPALAEGLIEVVRSAYDEGSDDAIDTIATGTTHER
jgi:hypothetical protein